MLTGRQESILDAVVREYVAAAEPVSSGEIVRKHRLPFSPATVRNELLALDEAGYLTQPHTSAGRIPTDKGYRFYINHLNGAEAIPRREEQVMRELRSLVDPVEFVRESCRALAHLTHNFAVAGFPEDEIFYKSGMSEIMHEPEFSDIGLMQEFSELVDMIEDEIGERFRAQEFAEPRTFVGAENPIREARQYGMIVSAYRTPFGKESVVALIGPKRMNYERNIALLKYLRETLNAE